MTDFRDPATPESVPIARTDHACFGCGDDNPIGLHLKFAPDGDGVRASFIPRPEHQGFHDVIHSGIISAVLDEAMVWATAHTEVWAVTGEMRVRFRHPLEIGEPTRVVARVSGTRSQFVTAAAELQLDRDGSLIATSSATFVKVDADVAATWRARYLRDPDLVSARLRAIPQDPAVSSIEPKRSGLSPDDSFPAEVDDRGTAP